MEFLKKQQTDNNTLGENVIDDGQSKLPKDLKILIILDNKTTSYYAMPSDLYRRVLFDANINQIIKASDNLKLNVMYGNTFQKTIHAFSKEDNANIDKMTNDAIEEPVNKNNIDAIMREYTIISDDTTQQRIRDATNATNATNATAATAATAATNGGGNKKSLKNRRNTRSRTLKGNAMSTLNDIEKVIANSKVKSTDIFM